MVPDQRWSTIDIYIYIYTLGFQPPLKQRSLPSTPLLCMEVHPSALFSLFFAPTHLSPILRQPRRCFRVEPYVISKHKLMWAHRHMPANCDEMSTVVTMFTSMLLHNSQETVWLWDKCAKSWQDGVATNNGGNSSHKLVDPATSKAEKPCLNLLHFIIHVYRFVALAFNHVPQKGSPRLKCVPTCTHILFNFKFVGGGMES